jgi:1-acyl-sn-glycerol-3-phosphate acyltransferase
MLARRTAHVAGALVGWAVFVLGTLLWGVAVIPLTLLLRPLWPGVVDVYAALTRATLHLYLTRLPFLRIRVEGVEKRLAGPRILVVNHQSRLDSPVMLSIEPHLLGPARSYILRVPIVGAALRLLGFFDADADTATFAAMQRAAARVRETGSGLLFYPEGTRSTNGEIGPFHRGAFRAAVDHDLPIQPVVIEGLDRAFPPGHWLPPVPGRSLVRIRYLAPIHPPYGSGPRRAVVRALAERVRTILVDELARLRAERGAS